MTLHTPNDNNSNTHGPSSKDERLDEFKRDIAKDAGVAQDQSDLADQEMRFLNVPGGMWEGWGDEQFTDRVRLELDFITPLVNRFLGEWALNRTGVEYKPNDAGTTRDDSDLLNGIYRADFRDNSGGMATDQGVKECVQCGYGAMKIATLFEDEGDPENLNQNIEWRPIHNAYQTVFWDNSAMRIDKRDARHCTVLSQFTRDSFKAEYPGEDPVSAYLPRNINTLDRDRRRSDIIFVATRYEIVKVRELIFVYDNLRADRVDKFTEEDHELIKDELKDDELFIFKHKRKVTRQRVEKTVFSGAKILEETRRIVGRFIPIIPFYASRYYIDGSERYFGMVRKHMDEQRAFNVQVSQVTENAGSAAQSVPMFDPDQMGGPNIANAWANKNNKSWLPVRTLLTKDGKPIAVGPVAFTKPSQLDPNTAALMQIITDHFSRTTGGPPQEVLSKDASGKAINARIKRENMVTQPINDNIARAIAWSGVVYQGMAAEVYTTQRIVKIISRDDVDSEALLLGNVVDEETGRLVESNNLRNKKFKAYADVGPQYETMREQSVDDMMRMLEVLVPIESAKEFVLPMITSIMKNMTGVGLDSIKELARKISVLQGFVKPETPEEEAMVAQAQQQKQQQQQQNPQTLLIQAAAQQQQAEARSLDASSLQKTADAKKKAAETIEITQNLNVPRDKLLLEAQKQITDQAREGLSLVTTPS